MWALSKTPRRDTLESNTVENRDAGLEFAKAVRTGRPLVPLYNAVSLKLFHRIHILYTSQAFWPFRVQLCSYIITKKALKMTLEKLYFLKIVFIVYALDDTKTGVSAMHINCGLTLRASTYYILEFKWKGNLPSSLYLS